MVPRVWDGVELVGAFGPYTDSEADNDEQAEILVELLDDTQSTRATWCSDDLSSFSSGGESPPWVPVRRRRLSIR